MDLDGAWQRALELAWQSFLAETTPVGAVVVGPAGELVAEGRGRRYEPATGDGPGLAFCRIAHAEVNALAALPPTRRYEDHILLTTLEPCCMCLGAAVQSTITRLHFAGRDPYAGTAGLHIGTPEVQRRGLSMTGPLPGPRGRFAELVHVRWLLDSGASGAVLAEQRRGIGEVYRQAEDPAAAGVLHRLRQDRAGLAQAMAAYERFAAGCAAR